MHNYIIDGTVGIPVARGSRDVSSFVFFFHFDDLVSSYKKKKLELIKKEID